MTVFNPTLRLDGMLVGMRKAVPLDFGALYAAASDKAIWKQHPDKDRWKEDRFRTIFDEGVNSPEGMYVIGHYESNQIIGTTRFYGSTECSTRIGYSFLAKKFWGTGINSEIKFLMLNHAFSYKNRVYFDIGAQNKRSRKAVEKLGARLSQKPMGGKVEYVLRPEFAALGFVSAGSGANRKTSCSCC